MKFSELPLEIETVPTVADRDRELVRRLRYNDATALDELLSLYWADLVRYAWSIVDNIDDAEDIAQQAFLQLWRSRSRLEHRGGGVHSYLLRIARNLSLNEQRRRKVVTKAGPLLQGTAPRQPTPAEVVEGGELQAAVEAALAALPARRREIFTLIRFHGLSYREAAEVMGISPQTVANQLSSALAELRRALSAYLVDSDLTLIRR